MQVNPYKNIAAAYRAVHNHNHRPNNVHQDNQAQRPQDQITLSREAQRAIRIDHQKAPSVPHDNKINSLEKWVDKATARTEANDGDIPFGMEWKLEYVTARIDKALATDIDNEGKVLNLTPEQKEKLTEINEKINALLYPPANDESAETDEETKGKNS